MTVPFEYQVNVIHTDDYVMSRFFNSDAIIDAVLWMIDKLPTEKQRADARVGIMLNLRHDDESSQ
jgi:hypothetical protein